MERDQEKLESLLARLRNPGAAPLSEDEKRWIEEFRRRYPFFSMPGSLAASCKDEESGAEPRPSLRDVVTAPSPESLARMRGNREASRFDGFYPDDQKPATPTTTAAIDDFLNTYGHQSEEEDELLERLIFNPIPDYAQQLAREEESSLPALPPSDSDSQEDRLNRFILSHRPGGEVPVSDKSAPGPEKVAPEDIQDVHVGAASADAPVPEVAPAVHEEAVDKKRQPAANAAPPEGLLSESLAKIYIKTRRYEQAYEILNGLSLRFPEKSAYFADQLRFLRKLIINERRRRSENQDNNNPNP